MAKLPRLRIKLTLALFCLSIITAAHAQIFQTLFTFDGNNGSAPVSLVQGRDGNFYGVTVHGGGVESCNDVGGCGTVFRITPQGELTVLHVFCMQTGCPDGEWPEGGLALGRDGNFYGTTFGGGGLSCEPYGAGCGTFFRITPTGKFTTLYRFCTQSLCPDGGLPSGGLVLAADGHFYGTTSQLGPYNAGAIFRITAAGQITVLYDFCSKANCADGAVPWSGLIQATDGSFYGVTGAGGTGSRDGCPDSDLGCGTIFRLGPFGKVELIYSFCSQPHCTDGADPTVRLTEGIDGSLFGTTQFGGDLTCNSPYGCGTIFSFAANGELTTLQTSESSSGIYPGPPGGLAQGTDGNLYGGMGLYGPAGYGTLFEMTPQGALTTLQTFGDAQGGTGAIIQSTTGVFYGTTGIWNAPTDGTIFSLDMGLGPFVTFVIPAGQIGQTGGILGQGFTGTTSVMLNGVPANFTVVSDTFILATVPAGATTGDVTVTTPGGVLTSNVPFRVIQ
jgi:uncharacterized repeat protein (TIGR03803 family)